MMFHYIHITYIYIYICINKLTDNKCLCSPSLRKSLIRYILGLLCILLKLFGNDFIYFFVELCENKVFIRNDIFDEDTDLNLLLVRGVEV